MRSAAGRRHLEGTQPEPPHQQRTLQHRLQVNKSVRGQVASAIRRRGRSLKSQTCVFICSDTGEATLRIIGVSAEDDGVYTCVATNELGSTMSSASLRVLGKRTTPPPAEPPTPESCGHELTVSVVLCLSCVHRRGQSELEGQLRLSLHRSG